MSHEVRTHQRTVNGKTVTVRRHKAADPAAEQKKRHAFERRVSRERQQAATQALLTRQEGEALYQKPERGTRRPRVPGERKPRKSRLRSRAARHRKKALRLYRRHKVKALMFAALAAGEMAAWAVARGAAGARKALGKFRQRRKKKGRKR